jgi:hypothetical protein
MSVLIGLEYRDIGDPDNQSASKLIRLRLAIRHVLHRDAAATSSPPDEPPTQVGEQPQPG